MMKRNWTIVAACSLIFAACGDNTDKEYSEKSTATTVTPDPTPSSSTPTTTYNPPDNVRTAFQTKYPNATNVTWSPYKTYDRINWEWTGWPSMDTTYYAVNYTENNRTFSGWWDRNMNWIGSTSTIEDSTMLPDPVKNTLKKSYSGYRIVSIDEENDKNRTAYEIKLEKGTARSKVLIDKNGRILKKKDENA